MIDLVIKTLHVLGAIVLLGTGTGIAFFMLMAHRSGDAAFIARTAGVVVVADVLFTASAGVLQPLTGVLLAATRGYGLSDGWFAASLLLYAVAALVWLPVVWMQIRMRDLAHDAVKAGLPLPAEYFRLFRWWFAFGIPGFSSVLAIVWLMVAKPPLFD